MSRARIARAERNLAFAEAAGAVRGLRAQAAALGDAGRRFRADSVVLSATLMRAAEAAYEAGEVGVLELLDAYRSAVGAELEGLELASGARRARIELDRVTGGVSR